MFFLLYFSFVLDFVLLSMTWSRSRGEPIGCDSFRFLSNANVWVFHVLIDVFLFWISFPTPCNSVLDISKNQIDDLDVLEVLFSMPDLRVLRMDGNPVVRKIPSYRKHMISRMPQVWKSKPLSLSVSFSQFASKLLCSCCFILVCFDPHFISSVPFLPPDAVFVVAQVFRWSPCLWWRKTTMWSLVGLFVFRYPFVCLNRSSRLYILQDSFLFLFTPFYWFCLLFLVSRMLVYSFSRSLFYPFSFISSHCSAEDFLVQLSLKFIVHLYVFIYSNLRTIFSLLSLSILFFLPFLNPS